MKKKLIAMMLAAATLMGLCGAAHAALPDGLYGSFESEDGIMEYFLDEDGEFVVTINGVPTPSLEQLIIGEDGQDAAQFLASRKLTLREKANANGKAVTSVKKGALVVRPGGDDDGWSYVVASSGKAGYVQSEYLSPADYSVPAVKQAPPESFSGVFEVGSYKKGSVYGVNLTQKELNEVKAQVDAIISAVITPGMSEYDKINALFGYLCSNCVYAPDWSKNRANSAWGALIYGEAQCSGYARGFKALCDAAGIECAYVKESGTGNGLHQWNIVRFDGQCYVFDGTGGIAFAPDSIYNGLFTWDSQYPRCDDGSMMYVFQ